MSGTAVYSKLKYESGVHRVQRVPQTETQGRVHTSTATVRLRRRIIVGTHSASFAVPPGPFFCDLPNVARAPGRNRPKGSMSFNCHSHSAC